MAVSKKKPTLAHPPTQSESAAPAASDEALTMKITSIHSDWVLIFINSHPKRHIRST